MTVDLGMLRRLVADSVEHTGKDEVWIKKDVLLELICENERLLIQLNYAAERETALEKRLAVADGAS